MIHHPSIHFFFAERLQRVPDPPLRGRVDRAPHAGSACGVRANVQRRRRYTVSQVPSISGMVVFQRLGLCRSIYTVFEFVS